jgi:hypothetical protein
MKKTFALLGILLLAGVSFAVTVPTLTNVQWNALKRSCCSLDKTMDLLDDAEDYSVYDGGCVNPDMSGERDAVWGAYYNKGNVYDRFYDMAEACDGSPTDPECYAATRAFYSSVSSFMQTSSNGMREYFAVARQAVLSNYEQGCGTTGRDIGDDIADEFVDYFECMSMTNEDVFFNCLTV